MRVGAYQASLFVTSSEEALASIRRLVPQSEIEGATAICCPDSRPTSGGAS
jgi:hypothetical protein